MAAAAAAAAAADEEEGIAEVGWKMPAQWTDGAWRASLLPRRLARLFWPACLSQALLCGSAAGVALRRGGGAAPAAEPGHPDL